MEFIKFCQLSISLHPEGVIGNIKNEKINSTVRKYSTRRSLCPNWKVVNVSGEHITFVSLFHGSHTDQMCARRLRISKEIDVS